METLSTGSTWGERYRSAENCNLSTAVRGDALPRGLFLEDILVLMLQSKTLPAPRDTADAFFPLPVVASAELVSTLLSKKPMN